MDNRTDNAQGLRAFVQEIADDAAGKMWSGNRLALRAKELLATHPQQERAAVPDGWVLVPRQPTKLMMDAALPSKAQDQTGRREFAMWSAMLAAAPAAPATPESAEPGVAAEHVTDAEVQQMVNAWCGGGLNGGMHAAGNALLAMRAAQPTVPALDVFRIAGGDTECCPNPTPKAALDCLTDLRERYNEALDAPTPAASDGGLRDALSLAATRLARLGLECPHGSSIRSDAGEWSDEAQRAANAAPPTPQASTPPAPDHIPGVGRRVAPEQVTDAVPLFYIQDSRTYVGNCPLWWCLDGKGYTPKLDEAGRYTKEQAARMRETDVAWPCEQIDAIARPMVDMQEMRRGKAQQKAGGQ